MKIITQSAQETKKFSRKIAGNIVRLAASRARQRAIIIGLQGELGSGKTTFVQGFLEYFGIQRVTSPTFVIIKKYSYKNPKTKTQNPNKVQNPKSKFQTLYLYHIDCYRLKNSRDLLELGLEEIINDPGNIVLIEWAEKIRDILPKNAIWIKFEHVSKDKRWVSVAKRMSMFPPIGGNIDGSPRRNLIRKFKNKFSNKPGNKNLPAFSASWRIQAGKQNCHEKRN